MRFFKDASQSDSVYTTFFDALRYAVFAGLRHIHWTKDKKDSLGEAILTETCDILGGKIPIKGRNGIIYAVLMLAADEVEQSRILRGEECIRFIEDEVVFDYAQTDLLCQLIEAIDSRVIYLGIPQIQSTEIITDIVFHICCVIDGSTDMKTSRGKIIPMLGFVSYPGGTATTTSGGQSFMHEYVHGCVDEYFEK